MTPLLKLPSWSEISLVLPEIWLAIGMCAVLLSAFVKRTSATLPFLAAVATLIAVFFAVGTSMSHQAQSIFGDMLTVDPFSQFFKGLLSIFTLLVILQWYVTSRHRSPASDAPDLLCLLLGATLGMSLMSSASNLLMIFVATESASFPSFALAGFRKRHRTGSEGSLKYVIFGAAASAIMVYGMSLVYGSAGTLSLSGIAAHAAAHGISPLMALGLLGMFAGIAFKLSAVPLHFWCPDVFQGAPIEVTTFLSVASKGAAICLALRVLLFFGDAATPDQTFAGMAVGVAILGAVTATWGNLVALHQTQFKRLLAYSSISHAGYMIMAVSLVIFPHDGVHNPVASSILFYLLVYAFMNLGAFTVAAIIADRSGAEDIRDYAGLSRRSPFMALMLSLFLFSLFGMPGLGGFMGKIYLATTMTQSGPASFALVTVLFINTLLSLYYYVRPVYYMYFTPDTENRPVFVPPAGGVVIVSLCAIVVVVTGFLPSLAFDQANEFAVLHEPPVEHHLLQAAAVPLPVTLAADTSADNHRATPATSTPPSAVAPKSSPGTPLAAAVTDAAPAPLLAH